MGRPTGARRNYGTDERPVVSTQREAGELLGVTQPTVATWSRMPGFPARADGMFDVEAILEWRQAVDGPQRGNGGGDEVFNFNFEKAREKKYHADIRAIDAERARLDLEEAGGRLLPRTSWEYHMAKVLTHLGDAADQLPDLLASECCDDCREKIRGRLKNELDDWRNETADELAKGPNHG